MPNHLIAVPQDETGAWLVLLAKHNAVIPGELISANNGGIRGHVPVFFVGRPGAPGLVSRPVIFSTTKQGLDLLFTPWGGVK